MERNCPGILEHPQSRVKQPVRRAGHPLLEMLPSPPSENRRDQVQRWKWRTRCAIGRPKKTVCGGLDSANPFDTIVYITRCGPRSRCALWQSGCLDLLKGACLAPADQVQDRDTFVVDRRKPAHQTGRAVALGAGVGWGCCSSGHGDGFWDRGSVRRCRAPGDAYFSICR